MATTATTEGHTIRWARLYDLSTELFSGRVRSLHRELLELAAIAPGDRVLDVGCGPGRLTQAAALVAGPAGETAGIDPSLEMIELARKKATTARSPATFRVAAIEAIPWPDGHFDAVLASMMIHHLPPELQRRGIAEVLRVLKPGGRFVAADFSATPGHGVGHILSVFGLRKGSGHAEHLRSLAAASGFESIQVQPATRDAFCLLRATKPGGSL